jgi:hypothetical protein
MRLSPPLTSVRPSNTTTAKASTQANPSSPNQNARSGELLIGKRSTNKYFYEYFPTTKTTESVLIEKLEEIFNPSGQYLDKKDWSQIKSLIRKYKPQQTEHLILQTGGYGDCGKEPVRPWYRYTSPISRLIWERITENNKPSKHDVKEVQLLKRTDRIYDDARVPSIKPYKIENNLNARLY